MHAIPKLALELPALLLMLGNLLWILAYVAIIRAGFRDRAYGIPLLAICLNIGWETFFFLDCPLVAPSDPVCPTLDPASRVIVTLWMLLDAVILYQLLRFGRARQNIPEIRRWFFPIVLGLLVFAFAWHYAFITFYHDVGGVEDAWIINLVMSALFILLLFLRPTLAGLSFPAAVFKMAGSALNALGLLVMVEWPFPGHANRTMIYLLFASVFGLDLLYTWLLHARRSASEPIPAPVA